MSDTQEEARKEARRAALRAEIARLKGILATLQDCLDKLTTQIERLEENIIDVESSYDLSVNETWVGSTYKKGSGIKKELHGKLKNYDGEMEDLKAQIRLAITKVEEMIRLKEEELASI